jgi:hypothetical protein
MSNALCAPTDASISRKEKDILGIGANIHCGSRPSMFDTDHYHSRRSAVAAPIDILIVGDIFVKTMGHLRF